MLLPARAPVRRDHRLPVVVPEPARVRARARSGGRARQAARTVPTGAEGVRGPARAALGLPGIRRCRELGNMSNRVNRAVPGQK